MAVTLEWVRDKYDTNKDRYIDYDERKQAALDSAYGRITSEQARAVLDAYEDHTLLPSYGTTPPPSTETRTMTISEGTHTLQVSLGGYATLQAIIKVSATGVSCTAVTGGSCGGSGVPRVSTSGWTVTTYLKSGTTTGNRCSWIATQDLTRVKFISDMVLAHGGVGSIGFTPSADEIGKAVLMYAGVGTPRSLWGC